MKETCMADYVVSISVEERGPDTIFSTQIEEWINVR
jgi:hypothetical protein